MSCAGSHQETLGSSSCTIRELAMPRCLAYISTTYRLSPLHCIDSYQQTPSSSSGTNRQVERVGEVAPSDIADSSQDRWANKSFSQDWCGFICGHLLFCTVQAQTREHLAAAQAQADSLKGQLEVSQAKLQRLDRSNAHLRKQRTQMMADIQVGAGPCCVGLGCAVLARTVMCYAMLCHAMPCCAVLCRAVLCSLVTHVRQAAPSQLTYHVMS